MLCNNTRLNRGFRLGTAFLKKYRKRRNFVRRIQHSVSSSGQPSLVEVFSAVSEGRLSPLDAAHTVEDCYVSTAGIKRSDTPRVINGRGKRAEWISKHMSEVVSKEGRVLVTGIQPADYAEIRKTVPGVVYHAGAKTLKLDPAEARPKLPGSVGIVADTSVSMSSIEELRSISEFFGCYVFQLAPISVGRMDEIVEQMKGAAEAILLMVIYDSDHALPDVVAGLSSVPVIAIKVGEKGRGELPNGAMSCADPLSAATSAARMLKSVGVIASFQYAGESARPDQGREEARRNLDESIRDALDLIGEKSNTVNNVVSNDVRESAEKI